MLIYHYIIYSVPNPVCHTVGLIRSIRSYSCDLPDGLTLSASLVIHFLIHPKTC